MSFSFYCYLSTRYQETKDFFNYLSSFLYVYLPYIGYQDYIISPLSFNIIFSGLSPYISFFIRLCDFILIIFFFSFNKNIFSFPHLVSLYHLTNPNFYTSHKSFIFFMFLHHQPLFYFSHLINLKFYLSLKSFSFFHLFHSKLTYFVSFYRKQQ